MDDNNGLKEETLCERCLDQGATHRFFYEDLCDDCYANAKALSDAERRASGRQIDYAELALGVETRDAELAALRAQYAGSQAALTTALGELAEARADCARFEAALDAANKELAQARAERVDALNRLGAGQIEYDSLYASLLDCQIERDDAEQMTAAYAEEVSEAEDDLERSRATIAALVVAFRIVWYCVVNEYPRALPTIKRLMAERQQAKQAGE